MRRATREQARKAAITHRIVASIPASLLELTPYATILLVSPLMLGLAHFFDLPRSIALALALAAALATALGSAIVVTMRDYGWFCITGLALVMVGACELLVALVILLRPHSP